MILPSEQRSENVSEAVTAKFGCSKYLITRLIKIEY